MAPPEASTSANKVQGDAAAENVESGRGNKSTGWVATPTCHVHELQAGTTPELGCTSERLPLILSQEMATEAAG